MGTIDGTLELNNPLLIPEDEERENFKFDFGPELNDFMASSLQQQFEDHESMPQDFEPSESVCLKESEPEDEQTQQDTQISEEQEKPAVVLVSDDDSKIGNPPPTLPPLEIFPKKDIVKVPEAKPKYSFSQDIKSLMAAQKEKQKRVDKGTYKKKGPGRNRVNGYYTTPQYGKLVKTYFGTKLKKAVNKELKRTDALITEFVRLCEKLPYHLVLKCSSLSIYKKKDLSSCLLSF